MKPFGQPSVSRAAWLILSLVGLLLVSRSSTIAQTFDVASLNGTYTGLLLGEGGRFPVAAVMVMTLDGAGNVSGGRVLFNVPDPITVGQRIV
jgi:hypothetical protein